MERNWQEFRKYGVKSVCFALFSIPLVPLFFFLMDPDYHRPRYFKDLLDSTRIGLEIGFFNVLVSTLIYGAIYAKNPELMVRLKKNMKYVIPKGIALMILGLMLASKFEVYIGGHPFSAQGFSSGMLFGGVTFGFIVFYVAYRQVKDHNLKLRAQSAEANLQVLKNQLQPHFLFNSLNSLAELIDSNKSDAAAMTQKLADLYREILESSKTPLSPLRSEFSIISNYLALEKLRFDDRLHYCLKEPENSQNIYFPSLALQTLVENALKHGISQLPAGGEIAIDVEPEQKGYRVSVSNTRANTGTRLKGTGTGLENTRTRLDLLYGERHGLKMEEKPSKTVVSFWFSGAADAP